MGTFLGFKIHTNNVFFLQEKLKDKLHRLLKICQDFFIVATTCSFAFFIIFFSASIVCFFLWIFSGAFLKTLARTRCIFTLLHLYDFITKSIPAGIYLLKVSNRNTKRRCEICSTLTIKIPERRHWRNCRLEYICNTFNYM